MISRSLLPVFSWVYKEAPKYNAASHAREIFGLPCGIIQHFELRLATVGKKCMKRHWAVVVRVFFRFLGREWVCTAHVQTLIYRSVGRGKRLRIRRIFYWLLVLPQCVNLYIILYSLSRYLSRDACWWKCMVWSRVNCFLRLFRPICAFSVRLSFFVVLLYTIRCYFARLFWIFVADICLLFQQLNNTHKG